MQDLTDKQLIGVKIFINKTFTRFLKPFGFEPGDGWRSAIARKDRGMTQCSLTFFRLLGAAHIAVAIALLPLNLFFGLFSLLIVMPGLIWLVILGFRLWRPNTRLCAELRNTHLTLVLISILLVAYGLYALHAAQRSAEAGGGLLGAFGLIPIVLGLIAGSLSMVSLFVSYSTALKNAIGAKQSIRNHTD